jgi:HlyD family secretion protein
MKRQFSVFLAASLVLGSLTGCGSAQGSSGGDGVPVQTVASILGYDLSGNNYFSGVVESRTTQKIKRDDDKQISEIKVEVGDEVKKGDVLFTYDKDSLELSVETAQLELEQIRNNISSYEEQITQLTKEKKKAGKSEQLSYSIQIQEAQLNLSEEQFNLKKKEAEAADLQKDLEDVDVVAEVDGMVQSIQDGSSSDNYYGTDDSFMTILETGVFQVKGTANEMTISSLYEGETMTIRSRVDENQTWSGQIASLNTDSTEESDSDNYSGSDSGESASKYSFTVSLDSSDGLMMGQHVYIEQGSTGGGDGISLYSFYIMQEEDGAYVWAADANNKLEKRSITLGDYDDMMDTYTITEGLSLEDAIAYPSDDLKVGDATSLYDPDAFSSDDTGDDGGEDWADEDGETGFDEDATADEADIEPASYTPDEQGGENV